MTAGNERRPIKSVVIVGGGSAGWMAAAALGRYLNDGQRTITLVESDAIATVGVGEATIPPIREFNALVGIDEAEFVRETRATFKLGIEFIDWAAKGDRYLHPFGTLGRDLEGVSFHQFWLKHRDTPGIGPLDRYWISAAAIHHARFAPAVADPRSPLSQMAHAYHFDAGLYAAYLRKRAEADGVRRIEGKVVSVEREGESGFVTALVLDDGRHVEGEFFIDCSGFRSLLLRQSLGIGYRDWSRWLACDSALAVPNPRVDPLLPVTRATAREAGWQWRIPLQHRTGNGLVYSSAFLDDDTAHRTLLEGLDAPAAEDPRKLSFTAGVHEKLWEKNVVALGLAGGFIEPLESTSIHLIQTGISKLLWLFPDSGFAAVEQDEYNRLMREQYEYVRDFVVLHYKATQRDDTPFWRAMGAMEIPDSLAHKIELFREKGRVLRYDHDLFHVPSWVAVLLGQGIIPNGYDPMVDSMDDQRVIAAMHHLANSYEATATRMPSHADHVDALCAARPARTAGVRSA